MTQYLKAIAAAVVTGLGTLQVAYTDNVVTQTEWIGVAIATIVALGAVWAIPNKPADTELPPAPPASGSSMGAQ